MLLTGATGAMGQATLNLLLEADNLDVSVMCLDTIKERQLIKPFLKKREFNVFYGDVRDYQKVFQAVKNADIVLHLAALVSPAADTKPELAMEINYGGTLNFLQAIKQQGRSKDVYFVFMGSVAQLGDRTPPIHWGRVGDPIKSSILDYYSVSKVAAERALIESSLQNWVSLRLSGMMGPATVSIIDPIILHIPLNNVLEYVSDRDASRMLFNLCVDLANEDLDPQFWRGIYNVGGGKSCRANTLELFSQSLKKFGVKNLNGTFKPNWFATRNFHGQYYLDSDKLENYLHFRNDSMDYFYQSFEKSYGLAAKLSRFITKIPGSQKLIKSLVALSFKKQALKPNGTLRALKKDNENMISAFWGSFNNWIKIPGKLKDFEPYADWDKVVHIDHGYDEGKAESKLDILDLKSAAKFRGGLCTSSDMKQGNWDKKLSFKCAFGHDFKASPRLILKGGHWCPHCENASWNYTARAKKDPFFAQVWNPLHNSEEKEIEIPKIIKPKLVRLKIASSFI